MRRLLGGQNFIAGSEAFFIAGSEAFIVGSRVSCAMEQPRGRTSRPVDSALAQMTKVQSRLAKG